MRADESKLPSITEEAPMDDNEVIAPIFPDSGPPPLLALPAPPSYSQAIGPDLPSIGGEMEGQNQDENGHRYVGLVNQAMTCYLNSLIQTLYMTPEFRNIIYKVERKNNARDIAFQLQKLFLQLQTSDRTSLETVDLTQSFGWENEVYDQHDVQELCWLMVEALEKRWANTQWKGMIENLFKGEVVDYVKCMNCKTIKSRNDIFLDLSLAVREDGATESHKTLQEALKAFIKPELLDGNNQYKCEKCDSLQDAQKGLGITRFPYLLVVQLKRFSFDYNTMHRIKLNDRLTFPDFLDLNEYLYKPPEEKPKMSWANVAKKAPSPTPSNEKSESSPEGDWYDVFPDSEVVETMLKKGPYVYELFSVMVHQGSATGGHYYAYIKNLDQQKWMCFNDSNVNFASYQEVQRTFGGSFSYGGMNNSNAYLLMYRRIEKERNEHFISTQDLPQHIKNIKEKMETEEREKEERKALEKAMVKVNVICNDFNYIQAEPKELMIHKETSFEDIKKKLLENYENLQREARLVECKSNWRMVREINKEMFGDKPPLSHLKPPSRWSSVPAECHIMIDTRERAHFQEIPECSQTAEVWLVDLDKKAVYPVKRVAFDPESTVGDLRGSLCAIGKIGESDPHNVRIVYSPYGEDGQLQLLDQTDDLVRKFIRTPNCNPQLYVDVGNLEILAEDRKRYFAKTEMFRLLDSHMYKMHLQLHLPSLNDYCRLGVFPPMMCRNGARSPIASPFAIQRGDGKPFSISDLNEDTNSSSTPCPSINEAPDNEVFQAWDSNVPTVSNIPLPTYPEGATLSSTAKQGSSSSTPLSASSTYSSSRSNEEKNALEIPDEPTCSKSFDSKEEPQDDGEYLLSNSDTQSQPASVPPSYESWEQSNLDQPGPEDLTAKYQDPPPKYEDCVSQIPLTAENLKQYFDEPNNDNASLSGNCTPRGSWDSSDELNASPPPYQQIDEFPSSSGENAYSNNEVEETESNDFDNMFEVRSKRYDQNGSMVFQLNVDKRMPVGRFQEWVAHQIKLPVNQVEFLKFATEEGCGFQVRVNQNDLMRDVMRDLHRVEVRPRLTPRQGEVVLSIHQYIAAEPNIDKRPVLFEVMYDRSSPVSHLLLKCQALLKEVYAEEYPLKQLRIRALGDDSAPLLQCNSTLPLDKKLFLQVIDDKQTLNQLEEATDEEEEHMVVVMVQRWCPQSFETLPLFELFLPWEESEVFTKKLRNKAAERSGIPVERVEFSEPFPTKDEICARYPFSRPISELIETVEFGEKLECAGINGKLVYIRDSEEERKVPTEDEKRVIRNKDQRRLQKETANTFRRMERPLRIQVASISESEP
ncbi:unnamed protein product [Bursaphelenchus xylophilus]|uniref:(pine wood nematode) hypothetical protein n=1 Tax=Bursaphelenchus xylophilus TaxID=6326 RepID=A0A1I7S971_BURXY|nr:unnamed protein product [Bursaphelenchus xylophilus]CAG9100407.1 unnamed protein product [Bursaphelenchus xylophilus]